MAKFPWFPMYAGDFLGSSAAAIMTTEQVGAYFLLLLRCWDTEDCSIPDDDQILASYSKMGERWLNGSSTVVRLKFNSHPEKVGFLTNLRLLEEWKKAKFRHERAEKAGIESGKVRKRNSRSIQVGTQRELKGNQSHLTSSLSSPPLSDSVLSLKNGLGVYSLRELVEKFNAIPGVSKCKTVGKTMATAYKARIQEKAERSSRVWWDDYLQQISRAPFLVGLKEGSNGPFHVSLDFILGPKNMDKILSGKYDMCDNINQSLPNVTLPRNPDAKTLLSEIDPPRQT